MAEKASKQMTRINYGGMGVGQEPSRDREGMGGTPERGPWVGALGACPGRVGTGSPPEAGNESKDIYRREGTEFCRHRGRRKQA